MEFKFLEPETITMVRLRQISQQNVEIQQDYIQRIRIHEMKHEEFIQIVFNSEIFSWDRPEEHKFKGGFKLS